MGVEVTVTLPGASEIELATAVRRGLLVAGDQILAVSDLLAPREPVPRHGIHMTETGFVRQVPGLESDSVDVGYTAFWAYFQEEDLTYHHPDGGQAKFLSTALLQGKAVALETIAAAIREALAL